MSDGDLQSFVDRATAALEDGDLSAANAELRIVLPLLKRLGWAVHGTDVVADYTARGSVPDDAAPDDPDGIVAADERAVEPADAAETAPEAAEADGAEQSAVAVDYALTLADRPAVLLVTAGTATDLAGEHGRRLRRAMAAADVDRGVITNGRSFVFVAAVDGDLREEHCSLAELPEREPLLSLYSKEAARARRRRRRERDRERVADALRERRERTVAAVADALVGDLEGSVAEELETAAETLVETTVEALDAGEHPGHGDHEGDTLTRSEATHDDSAGTGGLDGADGASGPTADGADAGDGTDTDAGAAERADADGTTEVGSDGADVTDPRDEGAPISRNDGGEYVVRFFDGGSSVGAVGNATSGGAVAQAVQYLVERHALDNRLDLPWTPEDAGLDPETVVVNREPVHADGTRMAAPNEIANGYHVETDLPVPAAREVVETLAGRSNLRVMFQGEWDA